MTEQEREMELEQEMFELDPMSGWTPFYGALFLALLIGLAIGCMIERHAEPVKGMIL